jgi:alpha/beta superfamily hydrolase
MMDQMDEPEFPNSPEYRDGKPAEIRLAGPSGVLEAIVEAPEGDVRPRPVVAIVCHPLPTEGGTMHNKVVTMAARALRECGATTVRFNFRGVGNSEGEFDQGDGEVDDLRRIALWVRAQQPEAQLWLAGFSFGAFVAYRAAAGLKPDVLIQIAPPVGRSWDFSEIAPFTGPWLVIQGDADEVVDPAQVYAWAESLEPGPDVVRIPDTSHFFHRKLMDLRGAVKNGVRGHLPAARSHG